MLSYLLSPAPLFCFILVAARLWPLQAVSAGLWDGWAIHGTSCRLKWLCFEFWVHCSLSNEVGIQAIIIICTQPDVGNNTNVVSCSCFFYCDDLSRFLWLRVKLNIHFTYYNIPIFNNIANQHTAIQMLIDNMAI